MAQRFGGKYSPNAGQTPVTEHGTAPLVQPPAPGMGRVRFLFILPLLFAVNGLRGEPRALVLGIVACVLIWLAAWLTLEGNMAQAAYDARKVARRPALPRKAIGAAVIGVGLFVGGMISQEGVVYPLLFGLLGAGLHLGAFGFDPMRDKGMEGIDSFQVERVAKAVDEAEAYLAGMKDAILRAKDRALEGRVDAFAAAARGLFRTVENDPGDLTSARKFLTVYLMGARDATVKFADTYAQSRDAKARADYEALLTDLETHFAERSTALLRDNHTNLDVEIQVLRERLQMET